MKYLNKQGNKFDNIRDAFAWCCAFHAYCCGCPLECLECGNPSACCARVEAYPEAAARLMGLEVIDEEEHMENKTKPLSEWTLGEVKAHCASCGDICDVCKLYDKGDCKLNYGDGLPENWDLEGRPRFTEEERTVLRYFAERLGIAYIARKENGGLLGSEQPFTPVDGGLVTQGPVVGIQRSLFPSIKPGQTVALGEIVGGER